MGNTLFCCFADNTVSTPNKPKQPLHALDIDSKPRTYSAFYQKSIAVQRASTIPKHNQHRPPVITTYSTDNRSIETNWYEE